MFIEYKTNGKKLRSDDASFRKRFNEKAKGIIRHNR